MWPLLSFHLYGFSSCASTLLHCNLVPQLAKLLYLYLQLYVTLVPQVFESKQWNDCLLNLLANTDDEIVLRGAVIVQHMVAVSKDVAEKILETQVVICC